MYKEFSDHSYTSPTFEIWCKQMAQKPTYEQSTASWRQKNWLMNKEQQAGVQKSKLVNKNQQAAVQKTKPTNKGIIRFDYF